MSKKSNSQENTLIPIIPVEMQSIMPAPGQTPEESDQNKPNSIENLEGELAAKNKKIDKLQKYIANLEADGDRLNKSLIIANSYRQCFDNITNPVFMVNEALEINYANRAFLEMTGTDPERLKENPKCGELLNCGRFRNRCLLMECFENKHPVTDFQCSYISPYDRKFTMTVDALPIHNIATNEILGGIEVFREVNEDTQLKFLMFDLDGQEYGVSIKRLKRIISLIEITPMPNMPEDVLGIATLRDQLVSIIDIKARLGLPRATTSSHNSIVILEMNLNGEEKLYGFIADRVNGVVTINAKDIDSHQNTGFQESMKYIAGIARVGQGTRILINAENILNVGTLEHSSTL